MTPRTGIDPSRGFSLLEVMVATAVLSLGIVLVYEAFFVSLEAFDYYRDYLRVASFADQKIWEAQNELRDKGLQAKIPGSGDLISANKKFSWNLSVQPVEPPKLYRVDLALSWKEGNKTHNIYRDAYALYETKN